MGCPVEIRRRPSRQRHNNTTLSPSPLYSLSHSLGGLLESERTLTRRDMPFPIKLSRPANPQSQSSPVHYLISIPNSRSHSPTHFTCRNPIVRNSLGRRSSNHLRHSQLAGRQDLRPSTSKCIGQLRHCPNVLQEDSNRSTMVHESNSTRAEFGWRVWRFLECVGE